jgi:hypothetical protein
MSETDTAADDRKNLVLRLPPDLLQRIDSFTSDRGGSRHAAILYLLDLGIGNDAEIARRVDQVKVKLRQKLEKDLAVVSD